MKNILGTYTIAIVVVVRGGVGGGVVGFVRCANFLSTL